MYCGLPSLTFVRNFPILGVRATRKRLCGCDTLTEPGRRNALLVNTLALSISFLVQLYATADAQVSTTGTCSPIIFNVEGDVSAICNIVADGNCSLRMVDSQTNATKEIGASCRVAEKAETLADIFDKVHNSSANKSYVDDLLGVPVRVNINAVIYRTLGYWFEVEFQGQSGEVKSAVEVSDADTVHSVFARIDEDADFRDPDAIDLNGLLSQSISKPFGLATVGDVLGHLGSCWPDFHGGLITNSDPVLFMTCPGNGANNFSEIVFEIERDLNATGDKDPYCLMEIRNKEDKWQSACVMFEVERQEIVEDLGEILGRTGIALWEIDSAALGGEMDSEREADISRAQSLLESLDCAMTMQERQELRQEIDAWRQRDGIEGEVTPEKIFSAMLDQRITGVGVRRN